MILKDIFYERVLGRPVRRHLPSLDGAWRPNDALEHCDALLEGVSDPTGVAVDAEARLYIASGTRVLLVTDAGVTQVSDLGGRVHGLSWSAATGLIAGVTGRGVVTKIGTAEERAFSETDGAPLRHPTAVLALPDGGIMACEGSQHFAAAEWTRDLMSKGRSGRVLHFAAGSDRARVLRGDLAYPSAIALDAKGAAVIAESWEHRLISQDGQRLGVELAGYPGGILRHGDGWVLSLFAPRSHIIEFVLEEDEFRQRMMSQIEPDYWIAPSTDPTEHPFHPAQVGGLRSQNILKPWAPPRSYGLVAELGADFLAKRSWHSRAGGKRHGMDALVGYRGKVVAASRGANALIVLPIESGAAAGGRQ